MNEILDILDKHASYLRDGFTAIEERARPRPSTRATPMSDEQACAQRITRVIEEIRVKFDALRNEVERQCKPTHAQQAAGPIKEGLSPVEEQILEGLRQGVQPALPETATRRRALASLFHKGLVKITHGGDVHVMWYPTASTLIGSESTLGLSLNVSLVSVPGTSTLEVSMQ